MMLIERVHDSVYCGRMPRSFAELRWLQERTGITRILNLKSTYTEKELEWCTRLGIQLFDLHLSGVFPPETSTVKTALRIIGQGFYPDFHGKYKPIYVCCRRGHERTGYITGLYLQSIGIPGLPQFERKVRWPFRWLWRNSFLKHARSVT